MERKLPEKWKYVQLGDKDYFERFGGGTPNKSCKDYWDDGTIPWLSNTELRDSELNIICTTKDKITDKGLRNSSATTIPRNCVLLTCTASIGKVGINEIELATNQQFNSFKCSDEVFPKYLAYFLLTQKTNLLKLGGSTSFCHINTTNLGKLKVPLPPLETQRRIVAILDKAEETRRLRSQADELAGRLIQSVFLDMFGDPVKNPKKWTIVPFENACETRLGKMLDSKQQNGLNNRYYMRNTNVQWGHLDLSSVLQMDFDNKEREEFRLKKDDVLICEGGEVGRSAIWSNELPECYFQKALHRVRPYPGMATPEYIANLMLALKNCGGLNSFTSEATIAHLTGIKLKGLPIPLPPFLLQTRFSEITNKMRIIMQNQKKSQLELNELFDTVMQKAFTGEL